MTEDEELDLAAYRRHLRYLIDEGKVHGIVATGSTGEFASLSAGERTSVVDTAIDEAGGEVPVVVGAAAVSTRDTIKYCQYAQQAGAAGVMLVHPYYCAPDEREMDEHLKAVAKSIDIPIMIYNNPFCSSYDMPPSQVARLAEIENISYIKESSGSVKRLSQIIKLCGDKMMVFCGDDLLPFESFALGAKGWVAAGANVFPKQAVELFELLAVKKDLDKAREVWFKLQPFTHLMESSGKFVQYAKAGCEIRGRPVGPPRKPFLRPTEEEFRTLKAAIDKVLE
jgi:4-hydroxy-tetrahydrodipicolinate synthase